jgi:glycosyl hydrolase family 16
VDKGAFCTPQKSRAHRAQRAALLVASAVVSWSGCSSPPPEGATDMPVADSGGTVAPRDTGSGTAIESGPALSGPPFGHPNAPPGGYPAYPGFTLWVAEEFDQAIDLDHDPIWTWSDGGLSEGQVRFQKQALSFGGGRLLITADLASNSGVTPPRCSHAENATVTQKTLISGEFRSRTNMFRYGRYEASVKAPTPNSDPTKYGNYVATLFVFRTPKYHSWRELDIEVTGNSMAPLTTNLLYAENTANWQSSIAEAMDLSAPGGLDFRAGFHTFAFEWLPTGVTWFVDGAQVRHQAPNSPLSIPEKSAKAVMNLWIFGPLYTFGGADGKDNQYPIHAEYDWFRFYKWDADAAYPCQGLDTSCLSADDQVLSSNNPCDGLPADGMDSAGQPVCTVACP